MLKKIQKQRIPGSEGACITSLAWVTLSADDEDENGDGDGDGDGYGGSDDDEQGERERAGAATGGPHPPLSPRQALVSAGLDGSLTLWDLRARAPGCVLDAGGGAIWSLAVDELGSGGADGGGAGRRLAAACDDGALRVFVAVRKTGSSSPSSAPPPFLRLSAALPRAEGRALSVAWHPGGRALVSGSSEGALRAWDVASRRELFRVDAAGGSGKPPPSKSGRRGEESSSSPLWAVAVAADGTLATGDGAGCVSLWDAEHGTLVARFPGAHAADVLALVCCPGVGGGGAGGNGQGGRRRGRGRSSGSYDGAGAGGTIFSAGADGRVASFVHQGRGDEAEGDYGRRVRQRGEGGQQHHQQQQQSRNGGWAAGPARAAHTHDVRCLALLSTPGGHVSSPPSPGSGGGGGAGSASGGGEAAGGPRLLVSGGADAQLIVYARASFATEHPARACRAPQPPLLAVSVPAAAGRGEGGGAAAAAAAAAGAGPALLLASQRRAVDVWRLGASSCFSSEEEGRHASGGRGKRGGGGGGGGKADPAPPPLAEGARVDVVARPSRLARLELAGADHVLASALASSHSPSPPSPSGSGRLLTVVVAASTAARTALFELREEAAAGGGEGERAVSVRRVPLPAGVPASAAVAFAGPRRLLAAACGDGSLSVIDLASPGPKKGGGGGGGGAGEEEGRTPPAVVASLAATLAAPASPPGAAPPSGATTAALSCPPVSGLAASGCGRWAATWSTGGACHVFDLRGLEHAWSPPPLAAPASAPAPASRSSPSSPSPAASPLAGAAFTADGDLLLLHSSGALACYDVRARAARPPTPRGAWGEDEGGSGAGAGAGAGAGGGRGKEGSKHGGSPVVGAICIGDLPGSPTGVSTLPKAGSRAVLVCTPSALCSADLAAPRTPGRGGGGDPLLAAGAPSRSSRRAAARAAGGASSPTAAAPAPAGTNPRPLPLEHPCLGSFFLSPREALLVEAVWADVAAKSLPPPVLRRRFGA